MNKKINDSPSSNLDIDFPKILPVFQLHSFKNNFLKNIVLNKNFEEYVIVEKEAPLGSYISVVHQFKKSFNNSR
ncbi:MAG: hypothetical protein JWM09_412 [Francisellaceae bacterium]|nr:hypothetical protein [Francisellaceae bacterium]